MLIYFILYYKYLYKSSGLLLNYMCIMYDNVRFIMFDLYVFYNRKIWINSKYTSFVLILTSSMYL